MTIVEKADSSNVLPSPLSISTKNRMTFLFANLKDRDFLVQRISDFLQQTTSKIYLERELTGSLNSSDDEVKDAFTVRNIQNLENNVNNSKYSMMCVPSRFTPSMDPCSPAAHSTVWAQKASVRST